MYPRYFHVCYKMISARKIVDLWRKLHSILPATNLFGHLFVKTKKAYKGRFQRWKNRAGIGPRNAKKIKIRMNSHCLPGKDSKCFAIADMVRKIILTIRFLWRFYAPNGILFPSLTIVLHLFIPIRSIKHAIAYLVLASKMVLMQPPRNKNPVNI